MTTRRRIQSFGGAGVLVLIGGLAAVLLKGEQGQILAMVLISLGLVLGTALVFYEVGLSEDRERAREAAQRARPGRPVAPRRVRPTRVRGHRRGPR